MHAQILGSPVLDTQQWHWADEADCDARAQALATKPELADAYIELAGPLGAGKTTFVRHLLRALGVRGRIKSPTYAVVEPHEAGTLAISHFDFYRFNDPREWDDAGLRDLFARPGLKLAEWAERVRGQVPLPDLALQIEPVDAAPSTPAGKQTPVMGEPRVVTVRAYTARGQALLR